MPDAGVLVVPVVPPAEAVGDAVGVASPVPGDGEALGEVTGREAAGGEVAALGLPPEASTRTQYDGFLATSTQKKLWMYQSCDSDGCAGALSGHCRAAERRCVGDA